MKVYVLCENNYDSYWIINVFATRELAEQERMNKFKKDYELVKDKYYTPKKLSTYVKRWGFKYFIEEYDVIEEVE